MILSMLLTLSLNSRKINKSYDKLIDLLVNIPVMYKPRRKSGAYKHQLIMLNPYK